MVIKEVTQALIQFIGLMMFAETPSQPTGALVVIPRVPTPGLSASVASHVEAHTAFIVFPKDHYDEVNSSWKASVYPRGEGRYRYVLLNGERITLTGNASNAAIKHPLNTGLPSLSACCNLPAMERTGSAAQPHVLGLNPKLRPEYSLPVAPQAAAVFSIPAGKLDACTAVAQNVDGRIDTLLKLENDGSLLISASVREATTFARRAPKTLVLSGKATVWIINAPWDAVTADTLPLSNVPHSLAYYDMIDPATCRATPGCRKAAPRFACNQSIAAPPGGHPPRTMPPPPISPQRLVDFQCSNSQWP